MAEIVKNQPDLLLIDCEQLDKRKGHKRFSIDTLNEIAIDIRKQFKIIKGDKE